MSQSQPPAVEAETTPGPLRDDLRKESKFRMSTQQELNCSKHMPSTRGCPRERPLLRPPSQLGPNRPASRKHSADHRNSQDDSLDWFDSIATHPIEPENTVPVSPRPKTSRGEMALKISHNTSQGKEKREPGQRSKLETGPLSAPGETEAPLKPDGVEGEKARKAAVVSEATVSADEPDSLLTHHIPRKLHKLRKERARELCGNLARLPSQPAQVESPKRGPGTPKRKKQKSPAGVEKPQFKSFQSPSPPVAKLSKFTFKQKSKLTHLPGDHVSPGTGDTAVQRPEIPQRGAGGAALAGKGPEKLASTSGISSSARRQGKTRKVSRQPPRKDRPKKRAQAPAVQVAQPESELESNTECVHHTCERDEKEDRKEEVGCHSKSIRVRACTLARLSGFSFTSPSESKSESPPPPTSKNSGEGGPNPPPLTTATPLGRKRKTFQLEGSTERLSLSKTSLFTLPELDDEPLDFDWDEEMRKKP